MLLKDIIKTGQKQLAPRIMLIGEEGCGKSTMGNRSESPLFICAENGLVGPEFVNTPNISPVNWHGVLGVIDSLKSETHGYKTLVFDTIDWLEPLLFEFICKRDGKENIEAYGYGKGMILAGIEWRAFLLRLENLRNEKNIGIIILAHCQIKAFSNPAGDNYDRYQAKCCKEISALTREWCDAVLFARFEVYTSKESAKGKAKAVGSDKRIVYTTQCPAWDAKNRYSMPEKLPLDYNEIMAAIKSGKPASTEVIIAETMEIVNGSTAFSEEEKKSVVEALEKHKANASVLKQILTKCRGKAS